MKNFLTAIAALLAVFSANALTVTYEGKPVTEGQVITFGQSDFSQQAPVPVLPWNCKVDFEVTSGNDYTLSGRFNASAKSENGQQRLELCGSSCPDPVIQGEYGIYAPANWNNGKFDANMIYPGSTGVLKELNWIEITVAQAGETLNFKVVFDTRDNAGINDVVVDAQGKIVVYTINGIKALETTDKAEINNLPAGLYIANGVKVLVK